MSSPPVPRRQELILIVIAAVLAVVGGYTRDADRVDRADAGSPPGVQIAENDAAPVEQGTSVPIEPFTLRDPSPEVAGP